MSKVIHASGKRKRAVARATLKTGEGKIMINNVGLDQFGNTLNQERIREPIILAGKKAQKYDYYISSNGGGLTGQADAIRLAIARALSETDDALKNLYLDYDRTLLVADVRRKEPGKPNHHGQARAAKQKSYR